MSKDFFDISTGFRYKKMEKSSPSIYRDILDLFHKPVTSQELFCAVSYNKPTLDIFHQ